MNYTHGQIAEYGTMSADQFSKVTRLDSRVHGRHDYRLQHHTPGFECAGSMARYNGHEVWSVTFEAQGAIHGRRFLNEQEARNLFEVWTTREAA